MNLYFDLFNSREMATIIWLLIFFIWIITKQGVGKGLLNLLKAFFHWKILVGWLSAIIYTGFLILMVSLILNLNFESLKDAILWFILIGLPLLFNVIKESQNKDHWKMVLLDSIKLIVLVEFLVNFYTFDLWVELIMFPALTIIGLISSVSGLIKEGEILKKVSNFILSTVGVLIIFYALNRIITTPNSFFSLETLTSFLLPPLLTFGFIPFLYCLAILAGYEQIFVRLNSFLKEDKKLKNFTKKTIFFSCGFNLNNLNKFSREFMFRLVRVTNKNEILNLINDFKQNK